MGKWKEPKNWIVYVYVSSFHIVYAQKIGLHAGQGEVYSKSGNPYKVTMFEELYIQPSRYLTLLRCSAIVVLDKIMCWVGHRKPLVEFCEFFANYPIW